MTYKHDGWNRLKSTTFGANLRSEYEYNGLNWRTVARFDAQLDEDLDQERVMYYDQSWRLLEERIDDDLDTDPGADRALQYVWGNRYIDDIAFRRSNDSLSDDDPDVTYNNGWAYLTDALFSVVAVVKERNAVLVERVQYDAYGAARHQRLGDVDGDGDTDGADNAAYLAVFNATIDQSGYNVDADINRDGVINGTDGTLLNNNFGAALPKGQLSNTDNIIGFDSYVFNAPDEVYTVRNRSYDTYQGRWLERDPAGDLDGPNFYAFCQHSPVTWLDGSGLVSCTPGMTDISGACISNSCPDAVRAAVQNHNATSQNAATCADLGRPVQVFCRNDCSAGGGATPLEGDFVWICTNSSGVPAPNSQMHLTTIHELVHARQRCTFPLLFANLTPAQRICAEMEAYCTEPDSSCGTRFERCSVACGSAASGFGGSWQLCMVECSNLNCEGMLPSACGLCGQLPCDP